MDYNMPPRQQRSFPSAALEKLDNQLATDLRKVWLVCMRAEQRCEVGAARNAGLRLSSCLPEAFLYRSRLARLSGMEKLDILVLTYRPKERPMTGGNVFGTVFAILGAHFRPSPSCSFVLRTPNCLARL